MDATILITAAAGLGTGVGYLLNAIRHRRQEANTAEVTTLEQVGRQLRRLGDIVEGQLAGVPAAMAAHDTSIGILKREVQEIKHDLGDVRREASDVEARLKRVERRLP